MNRVWTATGLRLLAGTAVGLVLVVWWVPKTIPPPPWTCPERPDQAAVQTALERHAVALAARLASVQLVPSDADPCPLLSRAHGAWVLALAMGHVGEQTAFGGGPDWGQTVDALLLALATRSRLDRAGGRTVLAACPERALEATAFAALAHMERAPFRDARLLDVARVREYLAALPVGVGRLPPKEAALVVLARARLSALSHDGAMQANALAMAEKWLWLQAIPEEPTAGAGFGSGGTDAWLGCPNLAMRGALALAELPSPTSHAARAGRRVWQRWLERSAHATAPATRRAFVRSQHACELESWALAAAALDPGQWQPRWQLGCALELAIAEPSLRCEAPEQPCGAGLPLAELVDRTSLWLAVKDAYLRHHPERLAATPNADDADWNPPYP